jgi:Methyltransferase domain
METEYSQILKTPGWMSEKEIERLINLSRRQVKENYKLKVLEIGSFLGRSAISFAYSRDDIEVICCDPWLGKISDFGSMEWMEKTLDGKINFCEDDNIHSLFMNNTKNWRSKIRPIRCFSEELVEFEEARNPDIIFIDGNHSIDGITQDLYLAHQLAHDNTLICGHDYNHTDIPQVTTVVNNFAEKKGYSVQNSVEKIFELYINE